MKQIASEAASGSLIRQIVIDRTAVMSQTGKLANVKAAVAQLIDQTRVGETLGIIAYDGAPVVVQPLTDIVDQGVKDAIKAALAGVSGGNADKEHPADAALGDALQLALDGLTAAGVPTDTQRAVYLITSGQDNTGAYPLSVIPGYAANYVNLYVVGYGVGAGEEANLRLLVEQANGAYSPVGDAGQLHDALLAFNRSTSLDTDVTIRSGWQEVKAGDTYSVPFTVDGSLATLQPKISFYGTPLSVTLALIDAQGQPTPIDPITDCQAEGEGANQITYCSVSLESPAPGSWQLSMQAQGAAVFVYYWMDGIARADQRTYFVDFRARDGAVVAYPQPIVVEATLRADLPIAGAVVTGTVEDPQGTYDLIQLHDDGVVPDKMAGDGTYAGYVDYWTGGEYNLTVQFDNRAGTAVATYRGLMTTQSVPDRPIAENFERYAELKVNVTGWKPDDHTDFSDDLAWPPTSVFLDNLPIHGRIDFADDTDVFSLTIPADYTGTLGLRVDNLGLGMDPYLRLYAADHSWEFERYLRITSATGGSIRENVASADQAIFVPLEVKPGEQFFVEVRHYDDGCKEHSNAVTGTYDISAGPYLWSDPIQRKSTLRLRLPLIQR